MPRPLAPALITAGYDAEDARDVGLRSHPDSDVWAYAQAHQQTIITFDGGFGDIRIYTPPHAGIIVAEHIETVSPATQVQLILDAIASLAGQSCADAAVGVSPGRVRVRR